MGGETALTFWSFLKRITKDVRFYLGIALFLSLFAFWGNLTKIFVRNILLALENFNPSTQTILGALFLPVLFYLVFSFAARGFAVVREYLFDKKINPSLREKTDKILFDKLYNQSYSFFKKNMSGDVFSHAISLKNNVVAAISAVGYIVGSVFMLLATLFVVNLINMRIFAIIFIWLFVQFLIFLKWRKDNNVFQKNITLEQSKTQGILFDSLKNISVLKHFQSKKYNDKKISKQYSSEIRRRWEHAKGKLIMNLKSKSLEFFLINFLLFSYSIYLFSRGEILVADIAYLFMLIPTLVSRIEELMNKFSQLYGIVGSSNFSLSLIYSPMTIKESKTAKNLVVKKGKIEFRNVSFSYGKTKILEKFSLIINPKEKVGVVGLSGAGKTTLMNLLLRNYDVSSGGIFVDGQNVREVKIDSLNKSIGLVPQHPLLFNRSILENVKIASPSASSKKILESCKLSGVHNFASIRKEKYSAIVGDEGLKLSGGERQRVALSRVFLKHFPILIVDEATSSLDSKTESLIWKNFENVLKDKTCLVISHRLSTLKNMDKIIVLDKGKIIEQGTHEGLLKKKGMYWVLWNEQTRKK